MSALYEVSGVSVDLPLPGNLLSAILPGGKPRLNLLRDISFTLQPSETFGLVGESGSGKTTLARAMLGLTAISVAVATAAHLTIVLLAAHLHPLLNQPGRMTHTRHFLAIGLGTVALWFLFTSALPTG